MVDGNFAATLLAQNMTGETRVTDRDAEAWVRPRTQHQSIYIRISGFWRVLLSPLQHQMDVLTIMMRAGGPSSVGYAIVGQLLG